MENNPLIAVDVLTKLINSPEIAEYAFYLYIISFCPLVYKYPIAIIFFISICLFMDTDTLQYLSIWI